MDEGEVVICGEWGDVEEGEPDVYAVVGGAVFCGDDA